MTFGKGFRSVVIVRNDDSKDVKGSFKESETLFEACRVLTHSLEENESFLGVTNSKLVPIL